MANELAQPHSEDEARRTKAEEMFLWLMGQAGVIVADALTVPTTGAPMGTIASLGYGIYKRNQADAQAAVARTFAAHEQKLADLNERVRGGAINMDEILARLTMLQRCVHEAGRHPDKELRDALGAFGARVLLEDLDSIERFEMAEALARLNARDIAYLEVLWLFGRHHLIARVTQDGGYLRYDSTGPRVGVDRVMIWSELARHGWKLIPSQVDQVGLRLEGMGLVEHEEADIAPGQVLPVSFPGNAEIVRAIEELRRVVRRRTDHSGLTEKGLRLLELSISPKVTTLPEKVDVEGWYAATRQPG